MKFVITGILIAASGIAFWYYYPRTEPSPAKVATVPVVSSPVATPSPIPDPISARAAVVMDASTGAILAAKNPDMRLMPASTTKMMTAYVALKDYSPDEIITITRSQDAIGKSTHFTVGEQYTVGDILKAALINSGNDSALSLGDHHPDGYAGFVAQMNKQALLWGLKNTHFTNVSGVEEDGHYSSAADLALIAKEIMKIPEIRSIVGKPSGSITSTDGKNTLKFQSTNELLGEVPGVIGIKTGWTDNAGECMVTYIHRNRDIITVVLDSKNRFEDTKTLINWIYQ